MVPQGMGFERSRPPPIRKVNRPGGRRPSETGWARQRCGSGPPLSTTESQPDGRAGTASKPDGTERCEIRVLGSPPNSVSSGPLAKFAATADVPAPQSFLMQVDPGS